MYKQNDKRTSPTKIPSNTHRRDTRNAEGATNDVKKTGRDSSFGPNQKKKGATNQDVPSEVVRSGRDGGFQRNQASKGTVKAKLEDDSGVTSLGDGISSVDKS